jgi:formate hydrogenlyase subunit 3/multisubunit Na+/H+ antiporter MnhD subunit
VTERELLALAAVGLPALVALLAAHMPRALVARTAVAGAFPAGAAGLALSAVALLQPGEAQTGTWLVVDATGGMFVAATALVGFASIVVSPSFLRVAANSLVGEDRRERAYYVVLYSFWSVLAAVPLAGNLGAAWILVEATTATSALLVGFSGKPRALGRPGST